MKVLVVDIEGLVDLQRKTWDGSLSYSGSFTQS